MARSYAVVTRTALAACIIAGLAPAEAAAQDPTPVMEYRQTIMNSLGAHRGALTAILNEDVLVDRYYLYNVIGGTGAFLVTAEDFEDFQEAILRKLIQEISGVPLAALEIPGKFRVALAPRPEDPEAPDAPGRGLGGP